MERSPVVRAAAVLSIVLWTATCSLADGVNEPIADPQNVANVLTELDSAGTPPTQDEIAEFLAASGSSPTGYWLARVGWLANENTGLNSRLRLSQDGLVLRAKWRRARDGIQEYGLAAQWSWGGLRLAAGQLGLGHGFGLLVAGPGRGPALTADGVLSARSRGLITWGGAAEPQSVLGAAVGWQGGRWSVSAAVGQRAAELTHRPETQNQTHIFQALVFDERWQIAALGLLDPAENGLSLAGRWRRGVADGSWEMVWRQPADGTAPLLAWLGQWGWRPDSVLYLECLMGWASAGPRPVMGQKHPVLAGWGGQGVAVRGTWRPAKGLGIKILVHGGQAGALGFGRRENQTLVDLQLSRRLSVAWRLEGRWRRGAEVVAEFSERFPWQPASLAWRDARDVVSLKAVWEQNDRRVGLAWRRLALSRVGQSEGWVSGGARSLLVLNGRLGVASSARMRLGWAWSWGDPVDLVSAAVPFGGYVLPRHWGTWRSEVIVGLEWPWRHFEAKIAVARRLPEPRFSVSDLGPNPSWAAWWEMVWRW